MPSKKIPISLNQEELTEVESAGRYLGISPQEYGAIPKTLKGSITLTKIIGETIAKLIPVQNEAEIELVAQTIKNSLKIELLRKQAEKAQKQAEKYNQQLAQQAPKDILNQS